MHKDLVYKADDIQHSPSLLSRAYTTHEEVKFMSQSQQNLELIYEVEVQNRNSSNVLEEQSIVTLENDEKTDQPTPSSLFKKEDVFKKNEEETTCVDEVTVGTSMEVEQEPKTLEDREYKEVSLTMIHIEKYHDRDGHDPLIN